MQKIISFVDNFLNRTTMYRVVLYYLTLLWVIAFIFSIFKVLPYAPLSLVISLVISLGIAYITNKIFSYLLKVPANVESFYISAFILALIMPPAGTAYEYLILALAGVFAMASKYIFTWKHAHIFNPAAFGAVATMLLFGQPASWWVGSLVMVAFVVAGGLLIIRKLRHADLAWSFFLSALVISLCFNLYRGEEILNALYTSLFLSPLFFFNFIMITEPLTTPPSRKFRILYGTLVGLLYAAPIHIGTFYFVPEVALLVGNVFSFLMSPKERLTLRLKNTLEIAPDTREFIFETNYPMPFKPGQYLEWTLGHDKPDARGNRRYFTIASSPTENELRLGIKFYPNGSTFKNKLAEMKNGDTILASQLAGDFVLPKDEKEKLVFVAGGIGITPFRSMVKYLIDTKQKRDIVLIYSNKKEVDIAYRDIFDTAREMLGAKIVYTLTDLTPEEAWSGKRGFVDQKMIEEEIPDLKQRTFYISGPPSMVDATKKIIKNLGLSRNQIKTDFFPGYV